MMKPGTSNGLDNLGGVVGGLKRRVIVGTRLFYLFVINVNYVDRCGLISSRGVTPRGVAMHVWLELSFIFKISRRHVNLRF